jgi:hypothetical protein
MNHRSFRSLKLLGVLAAAGFYAPALHAQTACEDVSGTWVVELNLPGTGTSQVTVTLEQTECALEGLVEGRNRTEIRDGSVEGSTATFTAMATNEGTGEGIAIVWEATIEGDDIGGTLNSPVTGSIEFTGTRAEG